MTVIDIVQSIAPAIASRAAEADQLGRLPAEDVRLLRDSRYLTLSIPREHGGQGATLSECVAAQLELAQASASTAMVAAMQLHLFGHAAEVGAWPADKFAWLCAEAVQGGVFNSVASEPALGSPSRGALYQTTITPVESGWRVNGHKTWTTGGRHLTHLLVKAQLDSAPAMILVCGTAQGVEWIETWGQALSLRASDSHEVVFKNVEVPATHLITQGVEKSAPNAWFPLCVTAVYLGTALAARSAVVRFALERVPTALGKPIATLPGIQRQLGAIDMALQAAQALLLEVAREWENGSRRMARVAAAKQFATETAATVTDQCLRLAGGSSLSHDLPLERYFRDTRAGFMHPPSGDTALEMMGKALVEK